MHRRKTKNTKYAKRHQGYTKNNKHIKKQTKYEQISKVTHKNHKKQLDSMMDIAENQCKKAGVDFVQKIVYGNPGYEIAKFANTSRNKIDMVVIGSRGRSSAKELFFGSTSQFVLHKSKPSVLIIK